LNSYQEKKKKKKYQLLSTKIFFGLTSLCAIPISCAATNALTKPKLISKEKKIVVRKWFTQNQRKKKNYPSLNEILLLYPIQYRVHYVKDDLNLKSKFL